MKIGVFLVAMAVTAPTASAQTEGDALKLCVQTEAEGLARSQASPSEIAQAALYRCDGEMTKRWTEILKSRGSGPTARAGADYAMDKIETSLTRMAIDTVIRARTTRQ